MAVLRKLGVKDTQHFSYITAEDLLREGMPLVTARILMRTYEASGNQSKWERKLEEEVEKVLQRNDAYSDEVLRYVRAALKELAVSTTQHFKHLKAEDLESKGVPPVIARILIKEFGPTRDESRSSGKENGFWENFRKFYESPHFPAVLSFAENMMKMVLEVLKHQRHASTDTSDKDEGKEEAGKATAG
ncbi:hypothetical protein V5799_027391 [Amblyomma americanum]|uniref:Uncharacterized protein n=1 Tax=Amblyomma americanum TaxID=6943 RepID=A0AAQ4DFV2_AMBAM